jgi:ABC-type bacteriocin/lantibiotic exporter with double-glycine peptidase domain
LPISNYRLENLYQYFGNALAEESLFEGTLHENITLGRGNITTDTLRWAIEKTGLTDYIQELPYGLDTPVDANGRKLSKSTIQKILIARSVINKPKLLLFENNIDCIIEKEKKKIIDFITDPQNGWTLIAISNDPYFMEKCQTILCIENGEIKLFRSEK